MAVGYLNEDHLFCRVLSLLSLNVLQLSTFDRFTKLATIQALAIYLTVLASEKERCATLSTVVALAMGVSK